MSNYVATPKDIAIASVLGGLFRYLSDEKKKLNTSDLGELERYDEAGSVFAKIRDLVGKDTVPFVRLRDDNGKKKPVKLLDIARAFDPLEDLKDCLTYSCPTAIATAIGASEKNAEGLEDFVIYRPDRNSSDELLDMYNFLESIEQSPFMLEVQEKASAPPDKPKKRTRMESVPEKNSRASVPPEPLATEVPLGEPVGVAQTRATPERALSLDVGESPQALRFSEEAPVLAATPEAARRSSLSLEKEIASPGPRRPQSASMQRAYDEAKREIAEEKTTNLVHRAYGRSYPRAIVITPESLTPFRKIQTATDIDWTAPFILFASEDERFPEELITRIYRDAARAGNPYLLFSAMESLSKYFIGENIIVPQ